MNDYSLKRTGFLFPMPSFSRGAAKLCDVFGTLDIYNTSESANEANYRALKTDWYAVGEDMKKVLGD